MVGIAFFFEPHDIDVWSGRSIDLDAWNYACKVAGDIDEVLIINHTEQQIKPFDIDMKTRIVKEFYPSLLRGHITQVTTARPNQFIQSLWEYKHHTDWYCFGPASGWTENFGTALTIPQAGFAHCHATHIASVVMFHRYHVWQSH